MPNHRLIVTPVISAAVMLALMPTISVGHGAADMQPTSSTTPAKPAQRPMPITFARGGRQAEIRLLPIFGGRRIEKKVALTAFGRIWSEPTDVVQTSAVSKTKVMVPAVRVPTLFSVVGQGKRIVGELVVYPVHDVKWDKNITLYSCGTPKWFDQWTLAVGLPVKKVTLSDLPDAKLSPAEEDGKSLLILGRVTAGKRWTDMLRLSKAKATPAVILDADWISPVSSSLPLRPGDFRDALTSFHQQTWPHPLVFRQFRIPNRVLCNRWALTRSFPIPLQKGEMPVLPLEVLGILKSGPWITISGIPWQEQLGRREQADELFLEILKTMAYFPPKAKTLRRGILLYPKKVVYDPKTMAYCPALACMDTDEEAAKARVLIVDLRGSDSPSPDLLDSWKAQVQRMGNQDRLLLLGDDPILDQWKWLKLDRTKKTAGRPGVVWLENDQPWDKTYEIPLMLKLTTLGVPLSPQEQWEN